LRDEGQPDDVKLERKKDPQAGRHAGEKRRGLGRVAVIADRFDGATFHGFFTLGFFLGALRLFVNEGEAAIIIALEIVGGGLAAEIAVDALVVDVKFACDVVGVSICDVSHKLSPYMGSHSPKIKSIWPSKAEFKDSKQSGLTELHPLGAGTPSG
jgi:hypothetical protein